MGDLLDSPRVAPRLFFPRTPDDLDADKNSCLNGLNFTLIIKTLSFFSNGKKNKEKSYFQNFEFSKTRLFHDRIWPKKKMF